MTEVTIDQFFTPFIGAKKVIFEIQLTQSKTFEFSHHEKLRGYVAALAQHPKNFAEAIVLDPLENGQSYYLKGDCYRFAVTVMPTDINLLNVITNNLQSSDFIASLASTLQLGRHTRFAKMYDGISHQPINHITQAKAFDTAYLLSLLEKLKQSHQWGIQLVTPMQLNEPNVNAEGLPQALDWQGLWKAMLDRFGAHEKKLISQALLATTHEPQATLDWQTERYLHFTYGKNNKPCGGQLALGWLHLNNTWQDTHYALLLLANLFAVGKGTSRGHGQFVLYQLGVDPLVERMPPYKSLLEKLVYSNEIKTSAVNYVNTLAHIAPEILLEDFSNLQHQWANACWPTPNVNVYQREVAGKQRTFVSTHALNSALLSGLQAGLTKQFSPFWHTDSYAYQKGKSRHNAHDRMISLTNRGYTEFYRTDIKACFESISTNALTQLIALYLPNDPLQLLIADWLSSSEQQGAKGLPMGLPISPVLCNLFLADLDMAFANNKLFTGVKLLRFADDLLILAKNKKHLDISKKALIFWLIQNKLTINQDKTSEGTLAQGVDFLGWRFIDGYSLVAKKSVPTAPKDSHANATREAKQVIVIAGMTTYVKVKNGKLTITQDGITQAYPWQTLEAVLCIGNHNITLPTIKQAMLKRVPIHLSDQFGHYQGSCCGHFAQHQALTRAKRLQEYLTKHQQSLANQLVAKRIHSIYETLRRRIDDKSQLKALLSYKATAEQAITLETLRGIEGSAARILWQQFRLWFAQDWHFTGRKKRPATDPINAMLSLGYTQLYALTDSILRTFGLWPYAVLYHQSRGEHACLASDYMEVYRAEVERTVLTLINRQQITPDDFNVTPQGVELSSEGRKSFFKALSKKLYQEIEHPSLLQQMVTEIHQLNQAAKQSNSKSFLIGKPIE